MLTLSYQSFWQFTTSMVKILLLVPILIVDSWLLRNLFLWFFSVLAFMNPMSRYVGIMVYDLKYMMLCMDVVPFAILVFRTLMTILFQFLFTFSLTLSAVFKDAQTILGILLGLIFAHSLMLFAICPSVRPFSTIFLKNRCVLIANCIHF